jgi:ribosomal protein S10
MRETKAERTTDTIIFHHKRITCPTISAADAIVEAAAKLNQTIQDNMKESLTTLDMNELDRLAKIFQEAAQKVSENDARQPRVPRQREYVATPRVPTTSAREQHQYDTAPRVISQEEDTNDEAPRMIGETDGPRYMTRNQKQIRGSIATDVMLTVMQLTRPKLKAQKLASRKYPLELLCEFANAVMDDETGDMLEYRQLIKRPKYRDTWSKAFGKEIGRLAQGQKGVVEGTDAIFFKSMDEVPPERRKDITYARICANYRPEKADPNRIRITLDET